MKTEKRPAKVGERILIKDARYACGCYADGDIRTVSETRTATVKVEEHSWVILHNEYEVIIENGGEEMVNKTAVLTEDYHENVAFVKSEDGTFSLNFKKLPGLLFVSYDGNGSFDQTFVHGEYQPQVRRIEIESGAGELTSYKIESSPAIKVTLHESPQKIGFVKKDDVKSPQARRDEIVAQSKADVEERFKPHWGCPEIQVVSAGITVHRVDFIINRGKRTVVALVKHPIAEEVYSRGIAKCAPDDCFNSHIGKAIALRRALGLPVPAEYLNAPQPTEVRVGDVVRCGANGKIYTVKRFCDDEIAMKDYGRPFRFDEGSGWLGTNQVKIIDDSRENV